RLAFARGEVFGAEHHRLAAGEDRGERVVDLMHDAGGQLSHGGELLGLGQTLLRLAPLGDIFADGDDVRDIPPVLPHGNLRDAVVARLAARLRLHFHLLQLTGVEYAVELPLQELARLPVQDVEDLAPHGVLARHALGPRLALAVPRANAVRAIDDVQADRERV